MSSYVYRGVEYTKTSAVADDDRPAALIYRGVSYTKADLDRVTVDKSKICYRGFSLAGGRPTAPGPAWLSSFSSGIGGYKLAH